MVVVMGSDGQYNSHIHYLLGIILAFMVNCSYASVTWKQANEVFQRLEQVNYSSAPLWYDDSDEVNAEATITGVHINKGMLQFLDNEDQLAEILGHELGHLHYGDIWHKHTKYMESRADLYGFELSKAAGFNACNGAEVLHNFEVVFGDEDSNTHPRNSIRYDALEKYCRTP